MLKVHARMCSRPALLLATVLSTAACGGTAVAGGPPDSPRSPKEHGIVTSPPTTPAGALACGQPFRAPAGGRLTITGRFPATAAAGAGTVAGTVEVTSREAVRGVAGSSADLFLVRDGRVVTMPLPQDAVGVRWDLAAGQVRRLSGRAALVTCDPAGGPVPPGIYQLYARVTLTPDDGPGVPVFGGPWTLELR